MPSNYDLNMPGAVEEVKRVLIELAEFYSDQLRWNEPQTETIWQHIDLSNEYKDAWDGATADELVLAMGRLSPLRGYLSTGPLSQLKPQINSKGKQVVIGGPQPTVQGLELLAQANHKLLQDSVDMSRYLTWRGGSLDSWFAQPPEALVVQSTKPGQPWDEHGWTLAWRDSPAAKDNPQLLSELDMIEESLVTSWKIASVLTTEKQRSERATILEQLRSQRDQVVRKLNKNAPVPTCEPDTVWSKSLARCVPRCSQPGQHWDGQQQTCVLELPTVTVTGYASKASCIEARISQGFEQATAEKFCDQKYPATNKLAFAGPALVAAVSLYWLTSKHDKPMSDKWKL